LTVATAYTLRALFFLLLWGQAQAEKDPTAVTAHPAASLFTIKGWWENGKL
jgi:hypothetical protein